MLWESGAPPKQWFSGLEPGKELWVQLSRTDGSGGRRSAKGSLVMVEGGDQKSDQTVTD